MTLGFILIGIVALLSISWIVAPLVRRDAVRSESVEGSDLSRLRELHARQQMLLASLRDLEDDRATDKLDDADYEALKARLSDQAIDIMKQIDGAEAERQEEAARTAAADRPLQYKPRDESESGAP